MAVSQALISFTPERLAWGSFSGTDVLCPRLFLQKAWTRPPTQGWEVNFKFRARANTLNEDYSLNIQKQTKENTTVVSVIVDYFGTHLQQLLIVMQR